MKILYSYFLILLASLSLAPVAYAETAELKVVRITPEGEDVKDTRQIVIEFNRAVVPIGRMERTAEEIPVTLTPALNCKWRWLNTKTLACNLDDANAMKLATKYNLVLKPGIRAEDGATIAEEETAEFVTERPDIRYAWFQNWLTPGTPVIQLSFNQAVTKRSVAASVSFNGTIRALVYPREDTTAEKIGREEARMVWLIRPAEELPYDADARVVLKPGLISAGPEHSIAERDVVQFRTYPDFKFVGLYCTSVDGAQESLITADTDDSALKCDPMASVSLAFTTPVLRSSVERNVTIAGTRNGKKVGDVWKAAKTAEEEEEEEVYLGRPHQAGNTYRVYLPYGLRAASDFVVSSEPPPHNAITRFWHKVLRFFGLTPSADIRDGFNRRLSEPFSVKFSTDHRKPNFELPHNNAVLEKGVDSELPIYVNNLKTFTFNYDSLSAAGAKTNREHTVTPPVAEDLQFAVPAQLRDMLDGKSGAMYGWLSTDPDTRKDPDSSDRKLFGQVTPYSVHVKLGHFSSLVWVTDLATGKPVEGAKVSLYRGPLAKLAERTNIAGATTDASGIALLPGGESFDPKQDYIDQWKATMPHIFVRVDKGEDMALLPLNYDFSVDIWRASNETLYPSTNTRYGHLRSWGTTAQGVYRVGQTMQYKLFARNESNRTLVAPPPGDYKLEIVDPTGKVVETKEKIAFNRFGAYAGEYAIPESAVMGWYQFRLVAHFPEMDGVGEDGKREFTLQPMRVLVSDFTPASFKVRSQLNGDHFTAASDVTVDSNAELYSGGAYTDASVRITASILPTGFHPKSPQLEGFSFGNGEDTYRNDFLDTTSELDAKGEHAETFTLPDSPIVYGKLVVESAVQDDRGKFIASEARADYAGRDRYVGLKSPNWVYEAGKDAVLQTIVVDDKGVPVEGTDVEVILEQEVVTMARVKGAGNAYLPRYTTKWEKVDDCSDTSTKEPVNCTLKPEKSGSYRAIATIKDTKGREHRTKTWMWVTGSDYVLWDEGDSNALPLVPEKAEYKVGDTARYLVRNPYPGATALVTIERYGVLDSFVTTLEGSTPTIEFEVKPDYLPGFYLSVIAMSPRADKPYGGVGEVDLGKPAYKLGYVEVPVKDPYKEIAVTAKVAKEEYRPRDTVQVTLHAEPKKPGKAEPIEVAAIALDEAVFDLITDGRSYFDPYLGLFTLDGLDVRNYSLLTRLIGRQKFEKKGANPGGDGGADLSMRNLFKFVAYWNPSLVVDAQGNASFNFEAPDNLTGWRILAIAATPSDRFGLGSADFKVNRPTEIRPVMPNQVMEGDDFTAQFSVMNRTDAERTLEVEITAQGNVKADKSTASVKKSITLAPYKRETVSLPLEAAQVEADRDAPPGAIYFTARAGDSVDRDGIEHTLPVRKARTLITAANYGTTTDDEVKENIAFPKDINTDVGSVSVVASPSVIANVEGAFRYMRDYPYMCWEQKLTKAVMASHYRSLAAYMPKKFSWDGSAELPAKTLEQAAGYQAPGGGMAYFKPLDDYADPYLSAYTALAFNWLRDAGYSIPQDVEAKLHGYLLDLLRHDTVPDFYSQGMKSDVRAMALAALAANGKVDTSDIARYRPHMKEMSLMGRAQFLAAASRLAVKDAAKETFDAIMSSGIETGGKFSFNETLDDSYNRILSSPGRENCAILSSMLAYAKTEEGAELVSDKPFKIVRAITQSRGKRDHWENTQENMFCMAALADYARAYETETPDMGVVAALDGKPFGSGGFHALSDAAQTFTRNIEPGDAGRTAPLTIARSGDGRLYYAARLSYAPTDGSENEQDAGIALVREYSVERDGKWELLKSAADIKRGELVRVDIYASLPTARNFVVIDDPVPGGLEPVNRDLATSSKRDADQGEFEGASDAYWFKFGQWFSYGVSRWSFYHQEIRHDSVRFYSDYLPQGNYHLSYTAQAIATGSFAVAPAKAEEMYDPDVFGTSEAGTLSIGEK